jgi:hypothetical protein
LIDLSLVFRSTGHTKRSECTTAGAGEKYRENRDGGERIKDGRRLGGILPGGESIHIEIERYSVTARVE